MDLFNALGDLYHLCTGRMTIHSALYIGTKEGMPEKGRKKEEVMELPVWFVVFVSAVLVVVAFIVGAGFYRRDKPTPPAPPAPPPPPEDIKCVAAADLEIRADTDPDLSRREAAATELRRRVLGALGIEEALHWRSLEEEAVERLRKKRFEDRQVRLGLMGAGGGYAPHTTDDVHTIGPAKPATPRPPAPDSPAFRAGVAFGQETTPPHDRAAASAKAQADYTDNQDRANFMRGYDRGVRSRPPIAPTPPGGGTPPVPAPGTGAAPAVVSPAAAAAATAP